MRLRAGVALAVLATAALGPGPLTPPAACAAGGERAVLVVDTGSQSASYCVTLDDQSVSGIELIVLASQQHGLSYRLGYGGGAVCMLAGVGTEGDDCFEKYPDFWGYWRGDGSGGWTWSSTGASSTTVTDGDVEGWSWGSGNDGSSHPRPPATRFGDACAAVDEPRRDEDRPKRKREQSSEGDARPKPSPSPAGHPAPTSGSVNASARRERHNPHGQRRKPPAPQRAVARAPDPPSTATPGSSVRGPIAAAPKSDSGPPAAGLAAVAVAATFAAAGAIVRARSRARPRVE